MISLDIGSKVENFANSLIIGERKEEENHRGIVDMLISAKEIIYKGGGEQKGKEKREIDESDSPESGQRFFLLQRQCRSISSLSLHRKR